MSLNSDTMNHLPWPKPWRLARPLAASALCLALSTAWAQTRPVSAPPVPPPTTVVTMDMALQMAWRHSVEMAEAKGRQARAEAEQAVVQSWLSAPAAVSLSQREGGSGLPAGARETELAIAMPLWRPGQRGSGAQAAEAEAFWAQAAEEAARLRLAGALREAAGAAQMAMAESRQADQQVETLRQLAGDVARRVKAGDLAPADLLAARAELLAAQAQARGSQHAVQSQLAAWRLLTGSEQLPQSTDRTSSEAQVPNSQPESHPELQLAKAVVALSQRKLAQVLAQQGGAPELTLGLRQERPGLGGTTQNSMVVGLRLPFGGGTHQQPRIAAVSADLETAQAQARRARERISAELALAGAQLQASQAQAEMEQVRAALLRERAQLIAKSFQAGESPLPELLRALGAAALADTASARQQAAVQLAHDRLQQALGQLP